ncbi:MAG TPA: hypothetical protein VFD92_02515 [Candidatus Binatia bacterium]|nr:hypothetical protein [Candidatus Binatia bacterium]
MTRRALDPAELAVAVSAALTAAHVPHAIGGAIAHGFWGDPRGTRALDVNVFLAIDRARPALDALRAAGVALDVEKVEASARDRGDARVFYDDIPVDLFFSSIPLHESAGRRTVELSLSGRTIPILSAEDLIVLKLLFFRGKDVVDVERMVALRGEELDRDYVRRWLVDCVGEEDERVARLDAIFAAIPANR